MKVAVILGTSRGDGNTRKLVDEFSVFSEAKVFDLADYDISFYDYEHHNKGDDFLALMRELVAFDHIVYATPLYWYCMSAQLKVFFDRISDLLTIEKDLGRKFKGKSASMLATGHNENYPDCFVKPIALTTEYLKMEFKGIGYASVQSDNDLMTLSKVAMQSYETITRGVFAY